VVSFFEASAEDIEQPICARLADNDNVLRQSCDASLLTQSIIDTVIDLAIPVSTAYQDVIETLEIDVLTKPNITHARDLYMITSEINTMRNFIAPIASLIVNLEEHGSGKVSPTLENPQHLSNTVKISPLTQIYLRDVEDHCFLITQSLNQLQASAKGMIDLIFHTISANQNESMKQLTAATMMFLPLSFITGYFGMNLTDFPSLQNSESFFWWLATPVMATTALVLLRGKIRGWMARSFRARMVQEELRRRG
jgi:Mg2+ and Co2+ transporter CorA